jgi:hypothetical protein
METRFPARPLALGVEYCSGGRLSIKKNATDGQTRIQPGEFAATALGHEVWVGK